MHPPDRGKTERTFSWRLALMLVVLTALAGLTVWVYQPAEDPYAGLSHDTPHPRMGGRLCLEGSEEHVVQVPNLDAAKHPEGPGHWRDALTGQPMASIITLLGAPDTEATAPSGHRVCFWWNFCAADDQPGPWTVHLMISTASHAGAKAEQIDFIAGGGRILGPRAPETATP